MDILVVVISFIVGSILGRILAKEKTRGVLMKVLDDYDKSATGLYLVLNCQPDELRAGEVVKFQVKETHPQK